MASKKPKAKKPAPAEKRPVGQPPFVPNDEQRALVVAMAGYRMPQEEMALLVINPKSKRPISETTLRKVFEAELRMGYATLKTRIMAASVKSALEGNVTAQIWLGKTLFGMREKTDILLPPAGDGEDDSTLLEAARRVAFTLAQGAHLARQGQPAAKKKA